MPLLCIYINYIYYIPTSYQTPNYPSHFLSLGLVNSFCPYLTLFLSLFPGSNLSFIFPISVFLISLYTYLPFSLFNYFSHSLFILFLPDSQQKQLDWFTCKWRKRELKSCCISTRNSFMLTIQPITDLTIFNSLGLIKNCSVEHVWFLRYCMWYQADVIFIFRIRNVSNIVVFVIQK